MKRSLPDQALARGDDGARAEVGVSKHWRGILGASASTRRTPRNLALCADVRIFDVFGRSGTSGRPKSPVARRAALSEAGAPARGAPRPGAARRRSARRRGGLRAA